MLTIIIERRGETLAAGRSRLRRALWGKAAVRLYNAQVRAKGDPIRAVDTCEARGRGEDGMPVAYLVQMGYRPRGRPWEEHLDEHVMVRVRED